MYCPKHRLAIIFILAAVVSLSFLLPLAIPAATVVSADGQGRQSYPSEDAWLLGVWGNSASDVFVVGYDAWGQGKGSTILHYDGSSWSCMNIVRPSLMIGRVWGSSPSDVFAVGSVAGEQEGTILYYNGSIWSYMGGDRWNLLSDVWGSSSSDVFAVGGLTSIDYSGNHSSSVILHYDGNTWSSMSSGTSKQLGGVWGSSSSDVFAVGYNPLFWGSIILHYDGSTWGNMSCDTSDWLNDIWGSSSSDVFAVGGNGTILHYNGISWSTMSSGTSKDLHGVWGSSSSDVFVVGDGCTILHYDGNWAPLALPTNEKTCIWVIIGPIIAVIVIGLLAYWFLRRRKPSVPPAPTTEPQ